MINKTSPNGFAPPPYPFSRLRAYEEIAKSHDGGVVDLSIGTPCDSPPDIVIEQLCNSHAERSYPASVGSSAYLSAASDWISRRFGVKVEIANIGACIGTKEFVANTPHFLKLRWPEKDTVLYPQVSYPTYEMGAILARCRAVPVRLRGDGSLDLESISAEDVDRAICLWSNSPSNPTGAFDDLAAAATWGRANGVVVLSDECYCEFGWKSQPKSILNEGLDGVVAVHSLSKRSNLAGVRAGIYVGDQELVGYLREVRQHAGYMVPGPVQAAAAAAWMDDAHVLTQRDRYRNRLERLRLVLSDRYQIDIQMPDGGFYLWIATPTGTDGWDFVERLAKDAGILGAPGEFYGSASPNFVRLAVVQPDEKFDLVAQRLNQRLNRS